jgi:hypothetical protein
MFHDYGCDGDGIGALLHSVLGCGNVGPVSRAQDSHAAASYLSRGDTRLKSGDLESAISDYGIALVFDPRSLFILRG